MKKVRELILTSIVVICLLGGWGVKETENPFIRTIDEINEQTDEKNWKEATEETEKLRDMYEREKWKYQLLGEESSYKGIEREIEKLLAALGEKDNQQSKVSTATIKVLYRDIYFMP
ncbi:DUF4363 family protein [Radiobacillus deserti]|uniref:DUF4363 family protein n=1 Tax=Radiobacillus deserti TaxID=2594883 RepID=A0A516KDT7_9BACI|nr:DUF4363 family protein [Radiobacillus deserti]QDP39559.1 DUF4363 family protein [Radiobacillus deserti]